jgi:hypothetical protein
MTDTTSSSQQEDAIADIRNQSDVISSKQRDWLFRLPDWNKVSVHWEAHVLFFSSLFLLQVINNSFPFKSDLHTVFYIYFDVTFC